MTRENSQHKIRPSSTLESHVHVSSRSTLQNILTRLLAKKRRRPSPRLPRL